MDDPFNPYLEWLGIRDQETPPNHYRLLGLELFESDEHIITNAADGMMARVRSYRPGEQARSWQQLLDEIATSRLCLLDADRKSRYDVELKSRIDNQVGKPTEDTAASSKDKSPGSFMWPPGMGPPPTDAEPTTTGDAPSEETGDSLPVPTGPLTEESVSSSEPTVPSSSPTGSEANEPPSVIPVETPVPPMPPEVPTQASPTMAPSIPAYTVPSGAPHPETPAANYPPSSFPPSGANPPGAGMPGAGMPDPMAPAAGMPATAMPSAGMPTGPTPGYFAPSSVPANPMAPTGVPGPVDPMAPVSQSTAVPVSPAMPVAQASGPYATQATAVPAQAVATSNPVTPVATPVTGQATMTAQPAASASRPSSTSSNYKQSLRKKSPVTMVIGIVCASFLLLAAMLLALKQNNSSNPGVGSEGNQRVVVRQVPAPSSKTDTKKTSRPKPGPRPERVPTPVSPKKVDPPTTPGDMPKPETQPETKPDPEPKPETKPETKPKPEPTATPEQEAALQKALDTVLLALSERDLIEATNLLEASESLAVTQDLKDRLNAVKTVRDGNKAFWDAVGATMKDLEAGEELEIGNTRVAVVESKQQRLVIRAAGRTLRYPLLQIPNGVALVLARRWFDATAPSTPVFIGSFLLVDPNGERDEVKLLWEQARQSGVDVDHLMPLLEIDLDAIREKMQNE